MDDVARSEDRNQTNLQTLTDEEFKYILDGDVDYPSRTSTLCQEDNNSGLSDVHPDDLQRKLDAVVEEDNDMVMMSWLQTN